MMKFSNMEQALYPSKMNSDRQKTVPGLSLGSAPLSHFDHNGHFQDLLSSTLNLGSYEAFQDADLPFEGLDTIEEVESCEELPSLSDSLSFERTQQFIEEMDEFIKQEEENLPFVDSIQTPDPMTPLQSTEPLDEETKEALQMLDTLIYGEMPLQRSGPNDECDDPPVKSMIQESSAFELPSVLSLDSLLESPSSLTPCSTLSPASSTITDFSPPSSVAPSPKESSQTREYSKSGRKKQLTIKDKRERKKWQNVEAARRYRDKKRAQVQKHLLQAKDLEDKNKDLKSKLKEVENELSTMKKLMTELGMIKLVQT